MGFKQSLKAQREERFIKEHYPWLMKYYNEWDCIIAVPEKVFVGDDSIRRQMLKLIGESVEHGRFVMFREQIPNEKGMLIPGYVICVADEF